MALLATACAPAVVERAPAAAAAEARRIDAAALRADFSELYRRLQSAHYDLYARVGRDAYDRRFDEMLTEMRGPETRLEAARRFQRFVAFGRVAHARIDEGYRAYEAFLAGGGRAFPLSLRLVDGRTLVVGNRSGLAGIAVGDEVVELDGRPMAAWIPILRRNLSADTEHMAAALLELDLPMLLWLERGEQARFALRLRRTDGTATTLEVPARTRAEMRAAEAAQPRRLDLAAADRNALMISERVAYLRPGAFYNDAPGAADPYDNNYFAAFIDAAFERFIAAGSESLLIDLRDNPGGDSSFSDLMIAWFANRPFRFNSAFRIKVSPEAAAANQARLASATGAAAAVTRRFAALFASAAPGQIVDFDSPLAQPRIGRQFAGRVYVLVNRNSFSNAVAVAATIQDHGFGTVLGEETSDLATTYGAMETFTLPRTGLVVGFPKAYIVRPSGDTTPRGVVPDIPIPTPLREGPEDPVLAAATAIAERQLSR